MRWLGWIIGGGLLLFGEAVGAAAASVPLGEEAARRALVARLWDALGKVVPGMSYGGKVLLIAHAMLESGWGSTSAFQRGNNPFNITRAANDPGPVVVAGDKECTQAGVCRPITQRFAAYATLEESIQRYLSFIGQARYGRSRQLLEAGQAEAFASELYRGGYFTAPLAQYARDLAAVVLSVQKRLPS